MRINSCGVLPPYLGFGDGVFITSSSFQTMDLESVWAVSGFRAWDAAALSL